jgi:phosphoserine phosphatase
VYARRLELIAPTAAELEELGRAYVRHADPGAAGALARLREMGLALHVISGGLRPALLPLTRRLGFGDGDVHAVDVELDSTGAFVAVVPSPLCTQAGKAAVARALALPRPSLAVGDGATDLALRPEVDAFAAYVGFVRRESVAAAADFVVASFPELLEVVAGRG